MSIALFDGSMRRVCATVKLEEIAEMLSKGAECRIKTNFEVEFSFPTIKHDPSGILEMHRNA